MSTRGSVVSSLLASTLLGVTTLTTPAGMSVCSSMIRASARPASGVSGDGLSTTVLPAASARLTFITLRLCGKFHGVRIDTTPSGSWRSSVVPRGPVRVDRLVGELRGEFACVQRHERGTVDLDQSLVRGAAPLGLRQRVEVVGLLHQRIAQLVEAPGALLRARDGPRPGVERAPRGGDRGVDLGEAGSGAWAIVSSVAGETSS